MLDSARTVLAALLPLLIAGRAVAGDLDDAPFGLRLEAALSRFSRYPDIAGLGGASAAAPWGSSHNSASLAWEPMRGASLQYSGILFDEGTAVHVLSQSASFPTTDHGVFQPSLAEAFSNTETMRDGFDFRYRALIGELTWAKRTDARTALGFGFSYSSSDIEVGFGGQTASETDSDSFTVRAGVLHELGEGFLGGFAVDYGISTSETTSPDARQDDTTRQVLLRPGICYRFAPGTRVFCDYQFGYFNDGRDSLSVHRLYAGVDHPLKEYLSLRVGTAVDVEGNVSFAAGFGVFPSERVFIDFSYSYDAFPELDAEFGRSHVLAFAVSFVF